MNRIGDNLHHFGPNEELVRALISVGVEFIVVGGLAVSWHCPVRKADDMDLLVSPTPDNSERVASALTSLRLSGHTPSSFTRPGLQVPFKQFHHAELLTPCASGPTFAEVAADATHAKLFNISVKLVSPASLIRMKRLAVEAAEAQRDKHLADIQCLEQHAA